MVEIEEEGETQIVEEINRIKGKTLCYYNRKVMEAIQIVVQLSIRLCPVKMVQLSLYNTNTVVNGDTFQIITLKLLLIVSVAEAADVVEVHALAEDLALDCYRHALVFLIALME